MKSWEHCAMGWYSIDAGLAIDDIKDNSIVKCELNNKEYFFNIPNEENVDITTDMIKHGEWAVYTWTD